MYQIDSEVATIQYEAEWGIVAVEFQRKGDIEKYEQAIEVAQRLAINQNTNRWLFIKNDFSDLNTDQFLLFTNACYQRFLQLSIHCKLAVYSKPQAFKKLLIKYACLKKKEEALRLGIFKSKSSAYCYLSEARPISPYVSFITFPKGYASTEPVEY